MKMGDLQEILFVSHQLLFAFDSFIEYESFCSQFKSKEDSTIVLPTINEEQETSAK